MSPKLAVRPILLSSVAIVALGQASPVLAQCVFTPTVGDDAYICDDGTSPGGLDDPDGNNRLTLPAGGTGTIAGDVRFGSGADIGVVDSGRIEGAVDQGNGDDSFAISAGTVTGQVQQGEGIDDFVMTGGELDRLNQGGSMDTFLMTGGRIVDAFDDGDTARMTGGRIGRHHASVRWSCVDAASRAARVDGLHASSRSTRPRRPAHGEPGANEVARARRICVRAGCRVGK